MVANPDELSHLYLQLINDLAYAQTYYKKSKLIVYLNDLVVQVFQKIYQTKREDTNALIHFFKTEVPLIVYKYRRYVLYAFIFFGLATLIGVVSAIYEESFVRLILGNGYVNKTLQNIEKGDAVAVYKSGSNWGSFIGITFNNLKVGLTSFAYGVTGGIGTAYIQLFNGIMRDSIKIVISTMPFTIAAGFLEGFVTRYSNIMPLFLALLIIFGTLSIITYYYLIYPFIVHKKILAEGEEI